jgi:outer membrane receptor for ferric coprogen and ferric-rhodotorulic acid
VERSRNVLDFSVRQAVAPIATLRLDVKNLLDAPYDMVQGTVTRESYHTGRAVNVALQWTP